MAATAESPKAVISDLISDFVRFLKAEFDLAKAEGTQATKRTLFGAVFMMGALAFFMLVGIFLLGAAAVAIGEALGHLWLGFLIVAGGLLVLSLFLGLIGFRKIRSGIKEGKQVGANLKEDIEWLRQLPKHNANEN